MIKSLYGNEQKRLFTYESGKYSMSKLVSIIMASYNYARYIPQAIDSILSQTYTNWELIIVDDGSKDNSIEVIQNYIEKYPGKIFLFTHPNNENRNIKATYELGISKIKGEYTAFLEADDYWEPDNLEEKISVLENNSSLSLVYSYVSFFGNSVGAGDCTYKSLTKMIGNKLDANYTSIFKYIFIINPINSFSNTICRTEYVKKLDLRKEYEIWCDYMLAIQMTAFGKLYFINKTLVNLRKHNQSANSVFHVNISENPYIFGTRLKIDMFHWFRMYLDSIGKSETIMKLYTYYFSWKSPFYRLEYNFSYGIRRLFYKVLFLLPINK